MKNRWMLAVAVACLAVAGCSKSATVEGEGGTKLTLTKPSSVTLERGAMAKTDLTIKRKDLPGEVTIKFTNLPKGVEVVDAGNNIVGDKGTYTLRASDTADLVENSVAQVTATGQGGISVSESMNVTVKEKKQ